MDDGNKSVRNRSGSQDWKWEIVEAVVAGQVEGQAAESRFARGRDGFAGWLQAARHAEWMVKNRVERRDGREKVGLEARLQKHV